VRPARAGVQPRANFPFKPLHLIEAGGTLRWGDEFAQPASK
jgi:hypothetical protein